MADVMTFEDFKTAMEAAEKLPNVEFLKLSRELVQAFRKDAGIGFVRTPWWGEFTKRSGNRVLGELSINQAMKEFSEITFDESRVGDPSYLNNRLEAALAVVAKYPMEIEDRRVTSLLVAWARRCHIPFPALPAWWQFRPEVVNLFTRRMTEGDGCCP